MNQGPLKSAELVLQRKDQWILACPWRCHVMCASRLPYPKRLVSGQPLARLPAEKMPAMQTLRFHRGMLLALVVFLALASGWGVTAVAEEAPGLLAQNSSTTSSGSTDSFSLRICNQGRCSPTFAVDCAATLKAAVGSGSGLLVLSLTNRSILTLPSGSQLRWTVASLSSSGVLRLSAPLANGQTTALPPKIVGKPPALPGGQQACTVANETPF